MLVRIVFKNYVRPTFLIRSESWCSKISETRILQTTEKSIMRAICGAQLKDRKRAKDLMVLLHLSKFMGHMTTANCVH